MKIGIDISVLAEKQRTGIAVYTYNLLEAVLKINKKDKFILFGIASFETADFLNTLKFKSYPNVEMRIFRLPKRTLRLIFLVWQQIGFPKIEHLIGPVDIFHSFNFVLPPQKNGKVVATVFDLTTMFYSKFHQPKTVQLERIRLKKISKFADLVVTISKNSETDFLKFSPKSRVEVIYPAVSKEFSKQIRQKKIDQILRKYNLTKDYILFVGTLEPRKNISNLIHAYLKSNVSNQLILVGAMGWKYESALQLINSPRIKLLDFIPEKDLIILYKGACCLVYPSFYEGFGIPVLEGLASRVPVITSHLSALPEVGGDGVLYADPKNIDDLSKKLKLIVRDRKLRKFLIKKGIKQAKKFDWGKSAKRLNFLYQQLVGLPNNSEYK